MMIAKRVKQVVLLMAMTAVIVSCDDKDKEKEKKSEPAPVVTSAEPVQTASAAVASASAAPTEEAPKPSHACPKGSEGAGTFKEPCVAKGKQRIMEVTWTGKMDEKGPSFRVVNKSDLEILYGKIAVYFYDKAGKQLKVAGHESDAPDKQLCAGNIFAGPMKPKEQAVITFSCVAKRHVPEGTKAIEAEMTMVGFSGKDSNKSDTYWKNADLIPDERPKGGIKK